MVENVKLLPPKAVCRVIQKSSPVVHPLISRLFPIASLSVHVENNPVQMEPVAHKSHQDMDSLVNGGGFLKYLQSHSRSGLVLQAALFPAFCRPGLSQAIIGKAAVLPILCPFVEKDSSLS